jgi:hypothetical protein
MKPLQISPLHAAMSKQAAGAEDRLTTALQRCGSTMAKGLQEFPQAN